MDTRLRAALTLIALILAVLLGYQTYVFLSHLGKEQVIIRVAPQSATLTVDSRTYTGPQTLYLEPGTHELSAYRDGFSSMSKKITVKKGKSQSVMFPLVPQTSDAKTEANDPVNAKLYDQIDAEGSANAQQEGEQFAKENPITNLLPDENLLYTIGYRADPNNENKVILVIDAGQGYRNAAVEHIRDLGFDPADYIIEFRDYTNPFTGKGATE